RFERVPQCTVDRVRFPGKVNFDRLRGRAVELGDEVGELVRGGAQVDGSADRVSEQRGGGGDPAVDRGRRAGVGSELDPGADRADAGVVDEGSGRQLDLGGGDVRFARFGLQVGDQRGVGGAVDRALEPQRQLWLEREAFAAGELEAV